MDGARGDAPSGSRLSRHGAARILASHKRRKRSSGECIPFILLYPCGYARTPYRYWFALDARAVRAPRHSRPYGINEARHRLLLLVLAFPRYCLDIHFFLRLSLWLPFGMKHLTSPLPRG